MGLARSTYYYKPKIDSKVKAQQDLDSARPYRREFRPNSLDMGIVGCTRNSRLSKANSRNRSSQRQFGRSRLGSVIVNVSGNGIRGT